MSGESVLTICVSPRSSRNRHEVDSDNTIRVWLTAPPVDGAANKAVVAHVAGLLGVPPSRIQIVLGQSSRTKRLRVPLPFEEAVAILREKQKGGA